MKLTPASTVAVSTCLAFSRSEGFPQMPSPVSCMAPYPARLISMSPPRTNVEIGFAFVFMANLISGFLLASRNLQQISQHCKWRLVQVVALLQKLRAIVAQPHLAVRRFPDQRFERQIHGQRWILVHQGCAHFRIAKNQ